MRFRTLVPLLAFAGLALAFPSLSPTAHADGRASRSNILPVSEIKKGMTGYGLTVFEGERPERFEIEVIDVLRNFRPRQELILVKTKHPRLEVAKIVAGMSGSPVYINDKMIGAYAYGWTFGVEPIAGVTPIRSMLDDLERPLPKTLHGLPLSALPEKKGASQVQASRSRFEGRPLDYDVSAHAAQLASGKSAGAGALEPRLAPLTTPLLLGGLTENAIAATRELLSPLGLEPLQAGGGGGSSASQKSAGHYVDGGAIGVSLVSGDMSAMGLGTVTRVEGNRLVAFGHPMMGLGVTSLPTTQARVLWFMASQQRSFKMGEATSPLGALVNDRTASIVVDESITAPTVPISLRIEGEPGAPYQDWNFEIAHDELLSPMFLAVAIGSGLEVTAAERRDVTWTLEAKLKIAGRPEVSLVDFGSAPSGTPQTADVMQSSLVRALGAVFNNPWEYARVERVDVKLSMSFGREVASLRGMELLTPVIDAGGSARVRVTLDPFAGERQTRVITVPIPKELSGRRVQLSVKPGYTVRRPRAAPESLDELVANLPDRTLEPRSLVVSYETGEGGVAHRGVVAQELPPGALDRLVTSSSSMGAPQFRVARHHVTKLPFYVVGTDSVEVEVRPALR